MWSSDFASLHRSVKSGCCGGLCLCKVVFGVGLVELRGVCTAHTCGCGLAYGFIRSAGSSAALQAALKGNLFPVVARCRGQVMSASAVLFCSAPEVSLLILFAHPTHPNSPKLLPSWPGQSPVSSKPGGLVWVSHCDVGQNRSCCSALYGHRCPAGTWDMALLVIPNVCGGRRGSLPPSRTSPSSP